MEYILIFNILIWSYNIAMGGYLLIDWIIDEIQWRRSGKIKYSPTDSIMLMRAMDEAEYKRIKIMAEYRYLSEDK